MANNVRNVLELASAAVMMYQTQSPYNLSLPFCTACQKYSALQHRVPKMLHLFPVEYVRSCSIIHYFNSTGTYRNIIVIF